MLKEKLLIMRLKKLNEILSMEDMGIENNNLYVEVDAILAALYYLNNNNIYKDYVYKENEYNFNLYIKLNKDLLNKYYNELIVS